MSDLPNLEGLPMLGDRDTRACPKPVPILETRIAQDRAEGKAWAECKRYVDERDRYRCRVCQRRTVKTLTVCAERAEHHRIVGRNVEPSLKFEPRNVLLVCLSCHGKLTRHELYIEGPRFDHQGFKYLDADCRLSFVTGER